MKKHGINCQLAPPHIHRRNAAEYAICTFKNYFVAGLASADPEFPVAEWDRLLPQAQLTLNLLRNARSNPKLSARAYLFGNFNFNATPLAPPGTRVILHNKPNHRTSLIYMERMGGILAPPLSTIGVLNVSFHVRGEFETYTLSLTFLILFPSQKSPLKTTYNSQLKTSLSS